jgi:hypothetical protein
MKLQNDIDSGHNCMFYIQLNIVLFSTKEKCKAQKIYDMINS